MISLWISACALLPCVDGASIQGRVLDSSGTPVADARVVLGEFGHATVFFNSLQQTHVATPGLSPDDGKPYVAELSTDGRGWFRAPRLATGEYSVLATQPLIGVGLATVRVAESQTAEVEIRMTAPTWIVADLSGLVFDAKRHTIELVPERNGTNVEFHPNLESVPGTWSFQSRSIPAMGVWRIVGTEVVFAQDYRATLFSFPVRADKPGPNPFSFDASKGLELTGSVVDSAGRPLSGVSVVARSRESGAEIGTVTDAQGGYRIRGLSAGKHVLEAMRWKLREIPGCGNGALDLAIRREITLPLADASAASLKADALLAAPKVGDPAPPFEARAIDGRPVSLRDLHGKVVLLDFWATWCGSCRMEMPRLVETHTKFSPGGRFEIVGVSLDSDPDRVPRFIASRGLAWPETALGPEAANPIARAYNVHSTPSTVLIDANGRIAALNLLGEPLRKKIGELLSTR